MNLLLYATIAAAFLLGTLAGKWLAEWVADRKAREIRKTEVWREFI
jgi:hypothetical protein